jgi:hypothetical protein
MYFSRPTYAVVPVLVGLYLAVHHRKALVAYLDGGAIWLLAYLSWSYRIFNVPMPPYPGSKGLHDRLAFDAFFSHLAIHVFSPGRGILVFIPILVFVGYLLLRYRTRIRQWRLAWLAAAMVVATWCVISGQSRKYGWAGVSCYGPRYQSGLVPWFALLGVVALQAMLASWRTRRARWLEGGAALLLLSIGIWIHGRGAVAAGSMRWACTRHGLFDVDFSLAWDWSCPQFLSGIVPDRWGNRPASLLPAGHSVSMAGEDSAQYLGSGWSAHGAEGRWTVGPSAEVVFQVSNYAKLAFELEVLPSLEGGRVKSQRVVIIYDDDPVGSFVLADGNPRWVHVGLPFRDRLDHILKLRLVAAPATELGLLVRGFRLVPTDDSDTGLSLRRVESVKDDGP